MLLPPSSLFYYVSFLMSFVAETIYLFSDVSCFGTMLTLREFTSPDRLAHLSGACARGIAFRRVLVSATHKQRLASSRLNSFSFHLAFSNAISLSHRHLQKSLCAVPRCARLYWDSLTNIPACYSAMPQHCSGQRWQRAVIL